MIPVSVVTPTYNHANLLNRAIQSVRTQTYGNVEHVIVDDASTDGTADLLSLHDDSIRYIRKAENGGLSESRNVGIEHATGERIVFLDADDELRPNAIAGLVDQLDEGPWVGVVPSKVKVGVDGSVRYKRLEDGVVTGADLRRKNALGGIGGGIFEREALEAVECFDASLRHTEDYDLYLRLGDRFSHYALDELLYIHYTGFADQLTSDCGRYEHRESIKLFLEKHRDRLSAYQLAERHYDLAHVCARNADPEEAITQFSRAIATFPFRLPYYYYLVAASAGTRQYHAARNVHEATRKQLFRIT